MKANSGIVVKVDCASCSEAEKAVVYELIKLFNSLGIKNDCYDATGPRHDATVPHDAAKQLRDNDAFVRVIVGADKV
jgi:hypothetical protein